MFESNATACNQAFIANRHRQLILIFKLKNGYTAFKVILDVALKHMVDPAIACVVIDQRSVIFFNVQDAVREFLNYFQTNIRIVADVENITI